MVGGYCKKMYTTARANEDVNENIYLVRVQKFLDETDEKYCHLVPIIDTSLFLRKVYFGITRVSVGKT